MPIKLGKLWNIPSPVLPSSEHIRNRGWLKTIVRKVWSARALYLIRSEKWASATTTYHHNDHRLGDNDNDHQWQWSWRPGRHRRRRRRSPTTPSESSQNWKCRIAYTISHGSRAQEACGPSPTPGRSDDHRSIITDSFIIGVLNITVLHVIPSSSTSGSSRSSWAPRWFVDISIEFIWRRPTWSIRWSTGSSLWQSSTTSSTASYVIEHTSDYTSVRRCFIIWVSLIRGAIGHYHWADIYGLDHQANWVFIISPNYQVKRKNITGIISVVFWTSIIVSYI